MSLHLNAPTAQLIRIDTATHPLFVRLWQGLKVERVTKTSFPTFRNGTGLGVLCLADDPVMYKETLDLAAVAPELFKSFEDALTLKGFTDPAEGRAIARRLGIQKLPAVALFIDGTYLGAVEGLQTWETYQSEFVRLLTSAAHPKKTIAITALCD